jgi:hypothetical protein
MQGCPCSSGLSCTLAGLLLLLFNCKAAKPPRSAAALSFSLLQAAAASTTAGSYSHLQHDRQNRKANRA